MAEILLEVCVDDVTGFDVAVANGADRIELCSTLELGGLTPSAGLMRHAADCPIAVYALIRPRAGDFIYSDAELKVMCADIDAARACGLRGVVFGASNKDGSLNEAQLARLVAHSKGMGITLHRAFDLASANFEWAVNQAVNLGFERILTSGGAATAVGGIEKLREIFRYAADRITIMPGAGIDAASVVKLGKACR